MRVVIQRVKKADVTIDNVVVGKIEEGLLILLGIEHEDTSSEIPWLCNKVSQLRIFSDDEGKMNKSVIDIDGNALVISQFTLHSSTKKGNRPSFIKAARPEQAIPLYEEFVSVLSATLGKKVETGEFGGDMKVSLINDGPVTIIIDSKIKE